MEVRDWSENRQKIHLDCTYKGMVDRRGEWWIEEGDATW